MDGRINMDHVDFFYWKLAALVCFLGLAFFFLTVEGLIRGKLSLPSWVYSIFTFTIGVFFFSIFVNSMNEYWMGRHDTMDNFIDLYHQVTWFLTFS